MIQIVEEILSKLPKDAKISEATFEGANIVLYTKNKDFFLNNNGIIREIVNEIKKRVELRPDPSLLLDMEESEAIIKSLIPKEAGVENILFDHQRSIVIIESEKPGLVIGKVGELLKEIRKKTLWVPIVQRTPALKSQLIENIRSILYEDNDYRKKFLDRTGRRIYGGFIREKKKEWIRVSILGGGREVGRSCLLLQTAESRVLLDCGINAALSLDDPNAFPFLDAPEFNIQDLDAVIISHSHTDHCALAPLLYKFGYTGPTYCTLPTRDISALLCLDLIGIAQKEAEKALYSSTDVKNMVRHTICLDYEEVTDITPDVRLTLYNSGHTLGSSMIHLHIGNGLHNLVYSGDFNYETSNLLAPAITRFPRLETLMTEGTYGLREDAPTSRADADKELIEIVERTVKGGGKILMPVLGVGRSQEIMVVLERLMREGLLEKIPIFIQGMVWDVTAIHTAYPDFFNNRVRKMIFHKDQNPFLSDIFKKIKGHKEMMQVFEETGPCIIMATSGMMVGGASVEYFKLLANNPKNSLIFTCYQGQGSLGRRIQDGDKEIVFQEGEKRDAVSVRMEIYSIKGFTGHSDYTQLLSFIRHLSPRPKKIIINHGEATSCLELASALHKTFRVETEAPKNLEVIRIK